MQERLSAFGGRAIESATRWPTFTARSSTVRLDWQRTRKCRALREERVARPEAETLFASSLEQGERHVAIEAALRDLPEKQREVLVMRIWGGLSFPQISAALSISADTAASRYRSRWPSYTSRLPRSQSDEPAL